MTHNSDRMRDLIHEAALEPGTERIAADFERAFQAISGMANRVTVLHGELWNDVSELRDELHAVANRLENVTQAMATRADLDDLRLEVREAVSTPFDPPEAA